MSEKMLNTRIQQKHDIEVNWSKAVNFIPKIGEVIIYDPDENHAAARVKIGDGVKTVGQLPFISEVADWNVNDETSTAYIKNKTHYSIDHSIIWDGNVDGLTPVEITVGQEYYKISNYVPTRQELIGQTYTITQDDFSRSFTITTESFSDIAFLFDIFFIDGNIAIVTKDEVLSQTGLKLAKGIYFAKANKSNLFISSFSLPTELKQLDEKFIPNSIARVDDLPIAITPDRIDEICGIEPVMTLVVDEDGDAVINAGFPDDEGNLTI